MSAMVAGLAPLACAALASACSSGRAHTSVMPSPSTFATGASIASAKPSASVATSEDSAPVDPEANAKVADVDPREGVGLATGPAGHVGAWLALGPFLLDDKERALTDASGWRPPARSASGAVEQGTPRLDDHAFSPAYGAGVATMVDVGARDPSPDGGKTPGKWRFHPAEATWSVASSGDGPIDLERAMPTSGRAAIGYLGGVVRLPVAQKLVLLLGVDDGVEVFVDGKSVYARDVARPFREDDDFVPLDLAAGDHTVLFKLRQRDGAWLFRARLVDGSLRAPLGVRVVLPKAPPSIANDLAASLSWVRVLREPTDAGYRLATQVRYPEGAPLHVPIDVTASLLDGDAPIVATKKLGSISIGPRGVGELAATLGEPTLATEETQGKDLTFRIEVSGRRVDGAFHPRAAVRAAIVRARALLARWKGALPAGLRDDDAATIEYLQARLAQFVTRGDADVGAELADAAELSSIVELAEQGKDPIAERTGVSRYAHVGKADGAPAPLVVVVPKIAKTGKKKLPLYVGLHGMDGGPMAMARVFFGGDVWNTPHYVLDRGMGAAHVPEGFGGLVLAPDAYGNAMYRQLGEEEVLDAIAWAKSRWPIDDDRVYVTGFSMGGIGAAAIPLHHPDVFAAAEPLCGYHSYLIRRDIQGRPVRPWERFLMEERSNALWAENGARLPLHVVHGKFDLPEANSGVLIEAYEKLGFSVKHEHPELGHDVWGLAYDHLAQVKWFGARRRDPHPRRVHFRTTRPRYGDDAWVHVERMASSSEWGVVDAQIAGKRRVNVRVKGIDALRFDRDPALLDDKGEITIAIGGAKLAFAAGAPLLVHREPSGWKAGAPSEGGLHKQGRITGPIRDVWSEPLTFVYGTQDPSQTTANLEVAKELARIRFGTDVRYPIVKDVDVDPAAAPATSIVLVGNARSNRVTAALEKDLPIQVKDDGVHFAGRTFGGPQLGAAFVFPHPKATDKYLLVIEGDGALGTYRALSLPELLPDFVIWDASLAPARGQQLLSFGSALAAGFFDVEWKPPASIDDPLAAKAKPGAKSEHDATAYLP